MASDEGEWRPEGTLTGPASASRPASSKESAGAPTGAGTPRPRVATPFDANWIDKAIAVLLWIIGVAWMTPMFALMWVGAALLGPDRADGLARLYTRGQIRLTGSRWRAVVDPAVRADTQYVFLQNHVNMLDHTTLYCATPHFKQGMELEKHFRYPVYGWYMRSRGTIPVRRGDPSQAKQLLRLMQAEISKGHSVLAFPEGTRTLDGRVGPFKKGIFFLARDLGVPVVPVTVTGMFEVMRKGSWLLRPGHTVTVHVDAPIPTAGLKDEELPALMDRVHAAMAAHVDRYYAARRAR